MCAETDTKRPDRHDITPHPPTRVDGCTESRSPGGVDGRFVLVVCALAGSDSFLLAVAREVGQVRTRIALCLALGVISAGSVWAGDPETVRTIQVSGTVETATAPDQVLWTITLSDFDKDLPRAKAANDEKVKSVVALRRQFGIEEGDLVTGHLAIAREYEHNQHGCQGNFKHFQVSRTVTIRQRDLRRFDELLDALVASAEMEVSFSFESSHIHAVRAETRLKALEAAKSKAEAMAAVVGARVGRAISIREHAENAPWGAFASNLAVVHDALPADVATERFVPGAITVRLTVYATFELMP